MRNITFIIILLASLFAQNEIQGRWHLVGYEDLVMYQFVDTEPFADAGWRYTLYSTDGDFGDLDDAGGSPNPYSIVDDTITIDMFFGTIVNYQMNFRCDGQVVEFIDIDYDAIHSTLFREGFDYFNSNCEEILEECFDFTNIDFGACAMVLGVGLLNDECSYISGCDWTIDNIDYSDLFFDGIEECEDNCSDDNLIDPGDLNGDGTINVVDIVMLVNIILNGEEYYPVADLNSDGTINVVDIVSLVNLVLYGSDTTIEDIDGNIYEIVEIGEQVWMAENLKTTRYSNGDEIIYIDNPNDWNNNFIGHYAAYNNDLSNVDSYGYLYNWSAANDNRGICPDGFHVPSDEEWSELIQYLDPNTNPFAENHNDVHSALAGGSLKDTGTIQEGDGLWQSPNTNATNVSGFSALPAGLTNDENQNVDLMGYYLGYLAWYWTSTAIDSDLAWSRELFWSGSDIHRHSITKNYGISVRCVSY